MATSSECRGLARTLMASFQENHEHIIGFIDRTAPSNASLPSLDTVLNAHGKTLALWADSRRLGKASSGAMKINEDKIASLWLDALPKKNRSPPSPRSPSATPRSRSRSRSSNHKSNRRGSGSAAKHNSGNEGPAGKQAQCGESIPAEEMKDSRPICSSYNSGRCSSSSCPWKHVCNWSNAKGDVCSLPHRRCFAHNPIFDKTRDSKIICSSYNAGNCRLGDCRNLHICNWRTPANEACARNHRRCRAH